MVPQVQEIYDKFKAYLSIKDEQNSVLDELQQLVLHLASHSSSVTANDEVQVDLLKLLIELSSDRQIVKTKQDIWKVRGLLDGGRRVQLRVQRITTINDHSTMSQRNLQTMRSDWNAPKC